MESTPNSEHEALPSTKPVAPYQGGKRNLAKRLCAKIADTPHKLYAEPFVGMGGVFLKRQSRPRSEIINDISADVTTLFRILQRHYVPFIEMLRYQLTSRSEFERLKETNPDTLTDLERAARFLYLQRLAFGGKVSSRNFGVSPGLGARFNLTKLIPMLEDLHERLSGVTIERMTYSAFINRYDRSTTLFYIDPPYFGCEKVYGDGVFDRDDFVRLSSQLQQISGRFILSINDVDIIRELFRWATIESVELTYTISGGSNSKRARELIITN
ncbi:MAG: DNA adenine methylase [Pseudomonadota bacterium]